MNDLAVTVGRTWCGKTRARITGRAGRRTVDVTVTGWRRTSALAEVQATFEAVSADPARFLEGHPR